MNNCCERLLLFSAGLSGAVAMVSYAASAHGEHALLGVVAPILLGHAAAFLGFSTAANRNRLTGWAGIVVLFGLIFFAGDLILRDLTGNRLFAMAAPFGGTVLIAGWVLAAIAALIPQKKS
jgi:uncharacterized membrane protein YgdD (TMEM256/DUF423 family)